MKSIETAFGSQKATWVCSVKVFYVVQRQVGDPIGSSGKIFLGKELCSWDWPNQTNPTSSQGQLSFGYLAYRLRIEHFKQRITLFHSHSIVPLHFCGRTQQSLYQSKLHITLQKVFKGIFFFFWEKVVVVINSILQYRYQSSASCKNTLSCIATVRLS
jgi:hypothetical protein